MARIGLRKSYSELVKHRLEEDSRPRAKNLIAVTVYLEEFSALLPSNLASSRAAPFWRLTPRRSLASKNRKVGPEAAVWVIADIAANSPPVPCRHSVGEKVGSLVDTTKQALLRKAARLVGHDELARRLNVPPNLLHVWLRGHASIPDRKMLPLADLLEQLSDRLK
jgi:hypothetical protein